MSKTVSFRFKNTPSDQDFANMLLESEREKAGYVSAQPRVQPTVLCTCKLPGFDANNPAICPTCKMPHSG
jgi:hypothetical protein